MLLVVHRPIEVLRQLRGEFGGLEPGRCVDLEQRPARWTPAIVLPISLVPPWPHSPEVWVSTLHQVVEEVLELIAPTLSELEPKLEFITVRQT